MVEPISPSEKEEILNAISWLSRRMDKLLKKLFDRMGQLEKRLEAVQKYKAPKALFPSQIELQVKALKEEMADFRIKYRIDEADAREKRPEAWKEYQRMKDTMQKLKRQLAGLE